MAVLIFLLVFLVILVLNFFVVPFIGGMIDYYRDHW